MKIAIYPGTFDPITNGHIDIIEKAGKVFDKIILAVAETTGKDSVFSIEDRLKLCRKSVANFERVEVVFFKGLVVDFARKMKAVAMIRGLRAVSDFEYELSLALMNKELHPELNTVFFVPENKYLYLSSSLIRQVASLNGEVQNLVPGCVKKALIERYG